MNLLTTWLQRRRVDREMAAEMAEHLAEKIEQLRDEGHSEEAAHVLAHRQFGNMTLKQEDSRAAWGWNAVEQLWQDTRFSWRVLRKAPAFTATAVIVLAFGIGMNTAMFSAVKAVLLSALPYPEPERMVQLAQTAKDGHSMSVSGLDFADWRAQSKTVETMATYSNSDVTLAGTFSARRARMAAVGRGFFNVVATQAAVGRTFSEDEQKPGGTPTIVFSYELAAALFGTAADALQKPVHVNGLAFTVIGVMPPKFDFPDRASFWLPNDLFPDRSSRSAHNYRVVGRLRPGVTLGQAQADMNVVAARLARQYIDDKDQGIRVASLYESLIGGVRPALLVLLGAVTLVLLIACVNISNLQLARAAARRKEMGMRVALGAARGRLIRQLLTESVLLASGGGLLGLALGAVAIRILRVAAPANIPRIQNLGLDGGVLCFTAALSLFVGILFGVLPALVSSKADVNDALKQGAGKGEGVRQKRWGQTLVVGQIALAIVLLSGAALLVKSYWKLAHVETGLASAGIYVADLTWPAAADGDSVDGTYVRQAGTRMLDQIGQLPEIKAAAFVYGLPLQGAPNGSFEIEGRPLPADPHLYPDADYRTITSDYFKAFGVPMLRGRGFTTSDHQTAQQVAIVNQSFQKKFFPDDGSLGHRIRFLGFDRKPQFMTIVGVVPDMRASSLKHETVPEVYANFFQHADSAMSVALVVRGPVNLQPRIERIIKSLNRSTAIDFESMDEVIARTINRERFQTTLLGVFAGCALFLAVVGIYGLLSYTVARRTSEMGLRMALGANGSRITRLVLGEGGLLVLVGVGFGLIGALLATRALQAMLYNVKSNDPFALMTVVAGFTTAAMLACYLPAYRASRIDPSEALRVE